MKDEIKEILEALKPHNDIVKEYPLTLSIEEQKILLDYITNLQKENEKLKQPQIFIDTMDMEERYSQELYEDYLKEQLEDYKSRNEKAIEYCDKEIGNIIANFDYVDTKDLQNVKNILKGDYNDN